MQAGGVGHAGLDVEAELPVHRVHAGTAARERHGNRQIVGPLPRPTESARGHLG